MKRSILVVIIAFLCNGLFAQATTEKKDSIPKYQQLGIVPPFKIMLAPDSLPFTKDSLKSGMSTIVMVFSPDCDHCIHSTKDLLDHYKEMKNVQIIMATPLAYEHVQKFYKEYAIAFYPAIKMGVDNTYTFGTFYEVRNFPAIFLYDKKGHFKKAFNGASKWSEIAAEL